MAITQYRWNDEKSALSQVDFATNSFGRTDAVIAAGNRIDAGALRELPGELKKLGITAYADMRDGKPVLVAYGFKKSKDLLDALQGTGLINSIPVPTTETTREEREAGGWRKFVQRYAIRLAAVSGLLGHASMATISGITRDWKWFGTAWRYTLADAVISKYGTDKSVTADPVMQDFKDYLWKQGVENDFVVARTDKISGRESFDNFMKKRSFQIANAAGAFGNYSQIQIGRKDGNIGFVVAGVTSMFGAGLQIFGSEMKRNPMQQKRKDPLSRLFGFIDANPMQVAAFTNFTDPFMLFHGAISSKKIDEEKIKMNNTELTQHYALLGSSNLSTSGLYKQQDKGNLDKIAKTAGDLVEQYKRKANIFSRISPFHKSFDEKAASQLEQQLKEERAALNGKDGIGQDGKLDYDFLGIDDSEQSFGDVLKGMSKNVFRNPFKKKEVAKNAFEQAAESRARIIELKEHNKQLSRGSKWKRPLLFAVATFYTGATLLRLIARKTASAEENKDAFNEVYSAAAQSLLRLPQGKQRDDMLLQMGHYLSNHDKVGENAEAIIGKLRERVAGFESSPFVDRAGEIPVVARTVAEMAAVTPEPAKTTGWVEKNGLAAAQGHEQMVEANRAKAAEQGAQPSV